VPVIAQEQGTGDVLMFAWMNREALQKTVELGRAVYFSRSRNKLWFKGEESGHVQTVHEIRMDCDNDVVLLKVTQRGTSPASPATPGATAVFSSVHLQDGAWHRHRSGLERPESIYK
jgi:phosphoribosyl-AMP cyclohydrolase